MFSRWDEKRKRARSSQFLSHWVIYATKALESLVTPTTKPRSRWPDARRGGPQSPRRARSRPAGTRGGRDPAGLALPLPHRPPSLLVPMGTLGAVKRSKALGSDSRLLDSVFPLPQCSPVVPYPSILEWARRGPTGGAGSPRPPEFAPRPEPLDFLGAVLGKGAGLVALPCPSTADSQEVTEGDRFTVFH